VQARVKGCGISGVRYKNEDSVTGYEFRNSMKRSARGVKYEVDLKGDERLDYLLGEDLRIIQSPSVFSFSLDAVLLAKFVNVPFQKGNLVDLCSGNGIIPLLLSTRTKGKITGVEIQERLHDMAVRSMEYNRVSGQINMIHGDIKGIPREIGYSKFDVVTCNPPYFPISSHEEMHKNEHFAIARHEIYCTLEDVVQVSSQLLRQGGKAAFVHRPGRLIDILSLMRQYRIEPKRLQFVYPKSHKEANTLLIEGIKDGSPDLKIEPPLIVYNELNEYTPELKRILYGDE
jgi:tRNA1(Val) A37 N6-methylase TrmN6